MYTYISIYFSLALIGLMKGSRRQNVLLLFALFFLFVAFVGFRFETGCDYTGYFLRWSNFDVNADFWSGLNEPGFFLLTKTVKSLGLDYVWLNVICAAIFFYFAVSFSYRHPRPLLLLAIMFPLLVIQLSMSGVRQALAVALLMGAFGAFFDGSRIKVAAYVLLASTFHQSAVIFLPLALMVGRTVSYWRMILAMLLLMPVALYLLSDRLDVYQARYFEETYGEMESAGALLRLGLIIIISLLFFNYRKRMRKYFPKEYSLMEIVALASLFLVPIAFVNTVVVHRLIYYVAPMQLFTFAALPYAMSVHFGGRRFSELIPAGVFLLYVVVWFSLSSHARTCYVPYDSFLFYW
ncbi:hypothetical protein BST95_00400 [Halioglobus japonicus]|uniref:EpsG family protein n=1 Tax=Halioglobus japonicus TaxID=930805 RepID=A0AAP8MBK2_9GAMM|nr:EpsG family protein [Halioglobus japonicus]AQA16908.1 hypothetical protein BST95_00400 [Halioglobus japonicus]PLW84792.1 EpsG family protein [Halioglobus japonicus]GHD21451.1 hypothetical protein GCM10007052_32230 [Halioglobus japonicus]